MATRGSTKNAGRRGESKSAGRALRKGTEGGAPRAGKKLKAPAKGTKSRITARTPDNSAELKQQLVAVMNATRRIRSLKRSLSSSFFEIGEILADIEENKLYEAKGYGSFEAFVDREVDLPKEQSMRIVRVPRTFRRDVAEEAGLDRITAALKALDGELPEASSVKRGLQRPRGPKLPAHKR